MVIKFPFKVGSFVKKICIYGIALLAILETNSVYDLNLNHMGIIKNIFVVWGMISLLSVKTIKKQTVVIAIYMILYFTIFFVVNVIYTDYVKYYFAYIFSFIIMFFLICNSQSEHEVFFAFENIILIICVFSIVFWTLGSVMGILNPTSRVLIKWGKEFYANSYFGIYFETQAEWYLGTNLYRNCGIFAEAPMYVVNIILALLVELFMKEKTKILNVVIFCVCIITAISFSGVILALFAIALKYYDFSRLTEKKLLIGLAMTIIGAFFVYYFSGEYVEKISSSVSRLDDYKAGFTTWISSPLFGTGFNTNTSLVSNMASFRLYNTGFSNSIMRILAQSGLYLFLLYGVAFIRGFACKGLDRKIALVTGAMYCLLLCTYSFNMLLFVAYGYSLFLTNKRLNNIKN